MKPHEETWYVEYGSVMVQAGTSPGGDDFLMQYGGNVGRDARLVLASAAPNMARALLAVAPRVDVGDGLPCWCPTGDFAAHAAQCLKARRALHKAGVLP